MDTGASIQFELEGKNMVLAQDQYRYLIDNLRSLALALEGLRQVKRHGGDKIAERAFAGFEALPNPDEDFNWRNVLGVGEGPCTYKEVERTYRTAAMTAHPDRGGSLELMQRINKAWKEAKEELVA